MHLLLFLLPAFLYLSPPERILFKFAHPGHLLLLLLLHESIINVLGK